MTMKKELVEALDICGFISGDKQESRLVNLLMVILKLQKDPPIPLAFSEIYKQIELEDPSAKLTKAWVHKVLKSLIEMQLIRVDNPAAHRKRYIADVNTVMAGLEQLKSKRIEHLENERKELNKNIEKVNALDCGKLAQEFVRSVSGTEQEISSRVVRGIDQLHRVLKYNMLDIASEGDIIRATVMWPGPFINTGLIDRMMDFIKAAERGAEIRYLVSTEALKIEGREGDSPSIEGQIALVQQIAKLRKDGVKFDVRFYHGPKTYNHISYNSINMALIISENPVTAAWITRQFNPDLIDNASKSFDRDWNKGKSFFDLTPQDMVALGMKPSAMISKIVNPKS